MATGVVVAGQSPAAAELASTDPAASATPVHTTYALFKGGFEESLNNLSYHSFRIPAIVRAKNGNLLAFAEGRAASNRDWGNINVLYKIGTNNGAAASDWSSLKEAVGAGQGTWGNPTPVVDQSDGTIYLFLSGNAADKSEKGDTDPNTGIPTTAITAWGDRRVYAMKSVNHGATFTGLNGEALPTDLTEELLPHTKDDGSIWKWDAVGPGNGIYTSDGTLVIPATHRNIYSTDHGQTWHVQKLGEETSEGAIAQFTDAAGTLYRNDRPTNTTWDDGAKRRYSARGSIAGGFSAFHAEDVLYDPKVQGSLLQYNSDTTHERTLFLNSASTLSIGDGGREKMKIRISYNNDATNVIDWEVGRPFSDGPAPADPSGVLGPEGGYSSLAKSADNRIVALVETNPNGANRSIILRKFNLAWILNG
ncbi:sialidase family protein [Actinocorallia aurea]